MLKNLLPTAAAFAAAAALAAAPALAAAEEPVVLSDAALKAAPPGARVAVINTERGIVEVLMLEDETPITAGNFIALADEHFYDGIPFHRVVEDFVIQAGDATLVGRENPDVKLPLEPDEHKCVRGAMSLARLAWRDEDSGELVYGDTSPNQFFILKADAPRLDDDFCVFGVVLSGMDVVDEIEQGDVIKSVRVVKAGG